MTKFDEIMSMIGGNKKKDKISAKENLAENNNKLDDDNDILEVSGSESNRAPLMSAADDNSDPDLIDQLYTTKWRNIPNRGEGASSWSE